MRKRQVDMQKSVCKSMRKKKESFCRKKQKDLGYSKDF